MSDNFNHGHGRSVAGAEHDDVDSFTRHRTRAAGTDQIIKTADWQKNGLRWWFHKDAPLAVSVWHHQMFKVIETKEKEKLPIFFKWNCWEDEEPTLINRMKRRRDGSCIHPPKRCPDCLFSEQVRLAVQAGEIRWTDTLFLFEGVDRSKTKLIRAGDFWGAFADSDDFSEEEIAELRREGINRREAWKHSMIPKCDYVLVGCDDDHIAEGCRIVVLNSSAGESVQKMVEREMKRAGREKADPRKHPYKMELLYDDTAKKSWERYKAEVIFGAPSDEVLKILHAEPADTGDLIARGDSDELRSLYEEHANFDRKLLARMLDASFPARDPAGASAKETDADERVDCDHCGAKEVMGLSDLECPACKSTYKIIGEGENTMAPLASRPCTACKTQIPLPGINAPGKFGDKIACTKCSEVHHEEMVQGDGGTTSAKWFHDAKKAPDPPTVAARTIEEKPARRRR